MSQNSSLLFVDGRTAPFWSRSRSVTPGTTGTTGSGTAGEQSSGSAGAGSVLGDGSWDGLAGNPLTQLWDTNEYDISDATGSSLDVATATPTGPLSKDCVVTVANLVNTA